MTCWGNPPRCYHRALCRSWTSWCSSNVLDTSPWKWVYENYQPYKCCREPCSLLHVLRYPWRVPFLSCRCLQDSEVLQSPNCTKNCSGRFDVFTLDEHVCCLFYRLTSLELEVLTWLGFWELHFWFVGSLCCHRTELELLFCSPTDPRGKKTSLATCGCVQKFVVSQSYQLNIEGRASKNVDPFTSNRVSKHSKTYGWSCHPLHKPEPFTITQFLTTKRPNSPRCVQGPADGKSLELWIFSQRFFWWEKERACSYHAFAFMVIVCYCLLFFSIAFQYYSIFRPHASSWQTYCMVNMRFCLWCFSVCFARFGQRRQTEDKHCQESVLASPAGGA